MMLGKQTYKADICPEQHLAGLLLLVLPVWHTLCKGMWACFIAQGKLLLYCSCYGC